MQGYIAIAIPIKFLEVSIEMDQYPVFSFITEVSHFDGPLSFE